jgi:hypothetical protein
MLMVTACFVLSAGLAYGQQPPVHDQLLDHMTGNWILHGPIAGKEITHDIDAEWVLGHRFVRIHEVSREKDAQGLPAYEAMVFVGLDQPTGEYVCAWLDTYGGLTPATFGRGKRDGDGIQFLFKDKDSVFHTRFIYHSVAHDWEWRMDSEEKDGMKPFARVKLTRK